MEIRRGYYIRQIEKCAPDARTLVDIAQEAGVGHVLLKVAEGERAYPTGVSETGETVTQDAIRALAEAGIEVWGWASVYGVQRDPAVQARQFADRLQALELARGVIYTRSGRWDATTARRYMQTLTGALEGWGGTLAISSYPYDAEFPLGLFVSGCRVIMPQVYLTTTEGDLTANLQSVVDTYTTQFPDRDVIPMAVTWGAHRPGGQGTFYWTARPDQMMEFLDACAGLGVPTALIWSWQDVWNEATLWETVAGWSYRTRAPEPVETTAPATEPEESTPGEVLLDVPYYSQEDASAQFGANDCGPACVRMVIGWDRQRRGETDPENLTIDDVTRASGIGQRGFATIGDLYNVAKQYDLDLVMTDGQTQQTTMDRIEAEIDAGRPVICLVLYSQLEDRYNQDFGGGHFVVVVGYTEDEIIINDPDWWGERRDEGHNWHVPREAFEAAMTTPNEWFGVVYQGLFVAE